MSDTPSADGADWETYAGSPVPPVITARLSEVQRYLELTHARLAAAKREVTRVRAACVELAARKEGDFPCAGCGRPCYASDETPAGYLCSRCGPHPAEEALREMRLTLMQALDNIESLLNTPCTADSPNGIKAHEWLESVRATLTSPKE